jgi:GNAT superfamily N-acetyltransferase
MWWKQTRAEFARLHGDPNRKALKAIVDSRVVPGILAYSDERPVGWCAVEPREAYTALERSRTLARVDGKPVWSVPCFYVARDFRGRGVMRNLLAGAIDWAGKNGARMIEAYPVEPGDKPASSLYTGVVSMFQDAGFVEVMRRSARRPIMRRTCGR